MQSEKENSGIEYDEEIPFKIGEETFVGDLTIPKDSNVIVIFCHGMNSSRHSPRNKKVARIFNHAGISTLLVSLEKVEEDLYARGGDLKLMTQRLIEVTKWLTEESLTRNLAIGYFGCGGGAAAAMSAAAQLDGTIQAIVCRGGRADLAIEVLGKVKTPVLLIMGELDKDGIALNELAADHLRFHTEMKIIEGASHLFEEEGKLDEVAGLAIDWYQRYLIPSREKIFFRMQMF
jgi:predicted alpha/beta-hydrolase family hydrolase